MSNEKSVISRHTPDVEACAYCAQPCGGPGSFPIYAPENDEEAACCSSACATAWGALLESEGVRP